MGSRGSSLLETGRPERATAYLSRKKGISSDARKVSKFALSVENENDRSLVKIVGRVVGVESTYEGVVVTLN